MGKNTSEGLLSTLFSDHRPSISRMAPAHSLIEDVQPRIRSRKDTEKSENETGSSASDFVLQHLRRSPSDIFDFTEEQELVEELLSTETDSAGLPSPLARLLTKYSKIAYAYQPEERKPRYPLLFLKHRDNVPDGVAFNYKDSEDIIATPWPMPTHHQVLGGTNFRSIALYDAVSLIECKPLHEFGREQIVSYAYELFEVRPEICGTYTLWARPQYYEIMWVDVSGVAVSPQFTWSDLAPLRHYVWSLYDPPDTHFLLDTTMKRHIGNPSLWSFHMETKDYCSLRRIFVGSPYGRRTNVYVSAELHQDSVVVIKDSCPSDEYHDFELKGIRYIHEHGVFPGVVRLLPSGGSGPVFPVLKTLSSERTPEGANRVKHRLVLGSTGQDLLQASTVLEMLMAIFDILEIHRALFKRRNILHRDMSIYNILIRPRHNPRTIEGKKLIDNSPVFIKTILKGLIPTSNEQEEVIDESESALLIDFDNYAEFKVKNQVNETLRDRTGTPMFIARSVCAQKVRGSPRDHLKLYEPMPQLEGEAKQLYIQTYGEKVYNDFCDEEGVTFHGVERPKTSPTPPTFRHMPEHDVESAFWVLYYALIQVNPSLEVAVSKQANELFHDTMGLFFRHEIHKGADSRDPILQKSFEGTLHPGLVSLSDMLTEMKYQILPEYGHLPGLNPEHLHEAMRRILLAQIVKMRKEGKPIPLQPGKPRKYRPRGQKETQAQAGDDNGEVSSTLVAGMKRKAQTTTDANVKRVAVSENLNGNDIPQCLPHERLE